MKILTIGGGSWGTALTILLANKNYECYLWEYNKEYREDMKKNRRNSNFLKDAIFTDNIKIIDDYNDIISECDIILLATPTQFVRNTIKNMKKLEKGKIIVNVAKGLEIGTLKRISEILEEELKEKNFNYVALTGPTHAEEIINKNPSAILAVSKNEEIAKKVQNIFSNNYFRVYTGTDVIGAELAGALKNCVAIVAGICDGLGYGDNAKAAIMTRAMGEMMIIGKYYKSEEKTFMGLAGFGDLVVTCMSNHSRNRYFGEKIGQGNKLEDIIKEMKMVSEGVYTIKALKDIIINNNLRAHIFLELYEILYNNKETNSITDIFMNRNLRSEF